MKFESQERSAFRERQQWEEEVHGQFSDKDKMIESLDCQLSMAQEEVHSVRTELETMKSERSQGQETQRMVMQQIGTMKRLIEEQKETEKDKEQLLIKIKAKDLQIKEMTNAAASATRHTINN
jgi:hypothetical protein